MGTSGERDTYTSNSPTMDTLAMEIIKRCWIKQNENGDATGKVTDCRWYIWTPLGQILRELQNFHQQMRIRDRELWFTCTHLTPPVYFLCWADYSGDYTDMKVCVFVTQSYPTLLLWTVAVSSSIHRTLRQENWVDSHSLLQRIFDRN